MSTSLFLIALSLTMLMTTELTEGIIYSSCRPNDGINWAFNLQCNENQLTWIEDALFGMIVDGGANQDFCNSPLPNRTAECIPQRNLNNRNLRLACNTIRGPCRPTGSTVVMSPSTFVNCSSMGYSYAYAVYDCLPAIDSSYSYLSSSVSDASNRSSSQMVHLMSTNYDTQGYTTSPINQCSVTVFNGTSLRFRVLDLLGQTTGGPDIACPYKLYINSGNGYSKEWCAQLEWDYFTDYEFSIPASTGSNGMTVDVAFSRSPESSSGQGRVWILVEGSRTDGSPAIIETSCGLPTSITTSTTPATTTTTATTTMTKTLTPTTTSTSTTTRPTTTTTTPNTTTTTLTTTTTTSTTATTTATTSTTATTTTTTPTTTTTTATTSNNTATTSTTPTTTARHKTESIIYSSCRPIDGWAFDLQCNQTQLTWIRDALFGAITDGGALRDFCSNAVPNRTRECIPQRNLNNRNLRLACNTIRGPCNPVGPTVMMSSSTFVNCSSYSFTYAYAVYDCLPVAAIDSRFVYLSSIADTSNLISSQMVYMMSTNYDTQGYTTSSINQCSVKVFNGTSLRFRVLDLLGQTTGGPDITCPYKLYINSGNGYSKEWCAQTEWDYFEDYEFYIPASSGSNGMTVDVSFSRSSESSSGQGRVWILVEGIKTDGSLAVTVTSCGLPASVTTATTNTTKTTTTTGPAITHSKAIGQRCSVDIYILAIAVHAYAFRRIIGF